MCRRSKHICGYTFTCMHICGKLVLTWAVFLNCSPLPIWGQSFTDARVSATGYAT